MITAQKIKVSANDDAYTINIPKEFNLATEEFYVNKIGDFLMMTPVDRLPETLEIGAEILKIFSSDFMKDGLPEEIPASSKNFEGKLEL